MRSSASEVKSQSDSGVSYSPAPWVVVVPFIKTNWAALSSQGKTWLCFRHIKLKLLCDICKCQVGNRIHRAGSHRKVQARGRQVILHIKG